MNRWPIGLCSRWCVIFLTENLASFFLFFFFNICVIRLRVLNLWRWFFFILNWHSLYFLSLFSLHVLFSDFIFYLCLDCMFFFQTLTNAEKPMPLKGTNVIQMPLAQIIRAHTTALEILNGLGMTLTLKVYV